MASVVGICNRALQKVGANRILALTDNSREARSCNNAYDSVRQALLRKYRWNFATTRVVLAPDSNAPAYDYLYQFTLPSDCLRIILPNDNTLDWQVEGRKILTNGGTQSSAIEGASLTGGTGTSSSVSLRLRYISDVVDPNIFDAMFREALAFKLAIEMCDELTQSNAKKQGLRDEYRDFIADSYLSDSLENTPVDAPEDLWVTARY